MDFDNYLGRLVGGKELNNESPICIWTDDTILKSLVEKIKINTKGHSLKLLSKSLKIKSVGCRDLYHWINGESPIPIKKLFLLLNLWKTICKISDKEVLRLKNILFEKTKYFSVKRGKKVKLPNKINSDLAYLIGYCMGDGHLLDINKEKVRTGYYEFRLELTDYSAKFMVNKIKPLLKEIFDIDAKIYFYKKRHACEVYISSKAIHIFLNRICGFPMGCKKGRLKIPSFIKNNKPRIKASFIAGFFDADGWISPTYKKIGFGQGDNKILIELIRLLKDINIESRVISNLKRGYEFSIKKDYIHNFISLIPLKHHNKINKMDELKDIIYVE